MGEPSRREFFKRAALMSGAAGAAEALLSSIARATAIAPAAESTFLDAEHVVILMQENRSFDHCYGTLQGVRGFNDPRAVTLPDGNPVWVQTDRQGRSFVPFRLNIKETSATWMGCLPHSRSDQVDARNGGRYDRWLDAKRSGNRQYADMPLTLGYYTREDLPFYYALADAFTVCDQHFCSALTCTTPNRVYLWTGTAREAQRPDSPVKLLNSEIDHDSEVGWRTFPELLEEHGVTWKIYQNELYIETGLSDAEHPWLSNFGDNPIEHFTQFRLRHASSRRRFVAEQIDRLRHDLQAIEESSVATGDGDARRTDLQLKRKHRELASLIEEQQTYAPAKFAELTAREQSLHQRAFVINERDPAFRQLEELVYRDGDVERRMFAPKGDILHQFREDFSSGRAPAVSWLVAPQAFSDHPDTAWFGAWYIAEALDILTQNPEVWRKTIFILTYDENDGYFDHVPPFVAPDPRDPKTGRVSPGIDSALEFVPMSADLVKRHMSEARQSSIGLGYRVPMVIASPWSRGPRICSQVFDHTSVLQFLEQFITQKTGRPIVENNISQWRRVVCGDLTSAFQSAASEEAARVPGPERNDFLSGIHRAKYKQPPSGFKQVSKGEIEELRRSGARQRWFPQQEPGIRPSCPLPYELAAEGQLDADRKGFKVRMEARQQRFGASSAGAPFSVRAQTAPDTLEVRDYAVAAGSECEDTWSLSEFADGAYQLAVHGPNGFYRLFRGTASDLKLDIRLTELGTSPDGRRSSDDLTVQVHNRDAVAAEIEVFDNGYGNQPQRLTLEPGNSAVVPIKVRKSFGWHDFTVRVVDQENFERRFAGRLETGEPTFSDPLMGGVDS